MKLFKQLALIAMASLSMTAMAETKIAVMNYQDVLFNSAAAEDATLQLRTFLEPEQKQLNDLNAKLQNREGRLQTDKDILTEEEVVALQTEMQELLAERNNVLARMQQAQEQSRAQFIQNFQPAVRELVAVYVAENGFSLILDAQVVLWNEGEPDLTEPMLEAFNNWYAEQKQAQQ